MWRTRDFVTDAGNHRFFYIHAICGPPFGVLGFFVPAVLWVGAIPPDLGMGAQLLLSIMGISYFFGLIPAVVHAGVMLLFSRYAPHFVVWLLLVPFSAALSSSLCLWVSTLVLPGAPPLDAYVMFSQISVIAAGLCLAVTIIFRQLPPALARNDLKEL